MSFLEGGLEEFSVNAPAKLNLHLSVLGKRPDGFHNLESIFVTVNFFDTLYFTPLKNPNLTIITMKWEKNIPSVSINTEDNIIFKALSLFREKTGFSNGLEIKAEKRIPPGSGLGGGSSDAASVLLALNRFAGFPLNRDELLETASVLGSDVPFFIFETNAALVKGRGESIIPVEIPGWFFVLVNPGFSSNTAAAFKLLEEHRALKKNDADFSESAQTKDFFLNTDLSGLCSEEKLLSDIFFNDFLSVFNDPEKSVYNKIICSLKELDAEFAGLSGSGSTCFGVFFEKKSAEKAAFCLRKKWKFVKICGIRKNDLLMASP